MVEGKARTCGHKLFCTEKLTVIIVIILKRLP